jgi:CDP-diacylglycerol--serine O-phosphatidyltransferase
MIKKHIPNFITCLNIFCGSLAVIFALEGKLTVAVILMIVAAVFDFLDGMAARLLKAYSPIGKDLDSLADVISFGLAPGMVLLSLMENALYGENVRPDQISDISLVEILFLLSAFLIPIFSALRLAKFNNDTRQTDSFIGLPTPANALLISSFALISEHGSMPALDQTLLKPITLLILAIVSSYLLISEIPMFSLKMKNLKWQDNKVRFIFLGLSIVLIVSLKIYGVAAIILTFILISVLTPIPGKKKD